MSTYEGDEISKKIDLYLRFTLSIIDITVTFFYEVQVKLAILSYKFARIPIQEKFVTQM